jgi:hypothetical protein
MMNILLAFSPFLAFIVLNQFIGLEIGLLAAAAVSLLLLARGTLIQHKTPKVLEVGTFLLFGVLALYQGFAPTPWSIAGVRLAVDAGLLLIVLVSMAIREPFTLQYARESVPQAFWNRPEFVRTNFIITAVWAAAFAVMAAIDLAWFVLPTLSPRVVIIVTLLALAGAARFTGWYPARVRAASQRITDA